MGVYERNITNNGNGFEDDIAEDVGDLSPLRLSEDENLYEKPKKRKVNRASSAATTKSKKRKKKKKRREQNSIVDDIVAQGIAEQTSQQHHSDDADRTKPTDVATIRSDSTLSDRLDRPKEVVAASAIALASNDGVPNQAQQLMDESKSKVEKVKRKTKKKRKSTSVIDDIFGF